MISIYSIKPKFQSLLRPFVSFLDQRKVMPNHVTLFTLFLSVASGLVVYLKKEWIWLYPFVFFVRMALNAIDGILAKEFNKKTKLGLYLNELGDMVSDLFLYLPLTLFTLNPFSIWVFIFLSLFSEVAGLLGPHVLATRRYDGPMGKSDRAFVISALAILFHFMTLSSGYIHLVFWALNLLLILTTYNRIKKAVQE